MTVQQQQQTVEHDDYAPRRWNWRQLAFIAMGVLATGVTILTTVPTAALATNTPAAQASGSATPAAAATAQVNQALANNRIAAQVAKAWSKRFAERPDVAATGRLNWKSSLDGHRPAIYAHRGARALMPAHSLGSYYIASILGADYVEPDLVLTKDGEVVCNHEPYLSESTDVADRPEFASRKREITVSLGGQSITLNDWFAMDFTLSELKTLRMRQTTDGVRPSFFNQNFAPLTFSEFLNAVQEISGRLGYPIGVIPEIKLASLHAQFRPDQPRYFEDRVLAILTAHGYPIQPQPDQPPATRTLNGTLVQLGDVVLQSFELDVVRYLRQRTTLPILYLVNGDNADALTPQGLDEAAGLATHIGPGADFLLKPAANVLQGAEAAKKKELAKTRGDFVAHNSVVREAHRRGLRVVVYTISDSREFGGGQPGVLASTMRQLFTMGIDGYFAENIPEAMRMRDIFALRPDALSR
ncbi:PLC-like phosphodiesterase [Thamnocephalis sphaerospora]|uniref:glycerophosphodiester phosphodiesterase n=1 Tax=Thamnocephalis sphaerospora TaxID=78915 RepID=A0A4P9XMN8_9FUNG|nr:PLC-like phosphodiesterase [Thamnocephalis sphaerospora]|eukprot:RKP07183.1 PLC-like phosphodiesterase [Thamnocephalis sphaerospora]